MKFSILIPTIKRHDRIFTKLKFSLAAQILPYAGQIEVLTDDSEFDTIGEKRNRLLQKAAGEYVAFVDADDRVGPNYIKRIMEGIDKGVDCCSLLGVITFDGYNPAYFEHSLNHDRYHTFEEARFGEGEIKYIRYPNHLNVIKSSIAKQFSYPLKNHGEDTDFATQVHNSGLLKTEHYIDEVIYYYDYISNKIIQL